MLLFTKRYPARCFGMYMQNSRLQNRICSREFKTHRFALLQDNASWTNLLTCTAVCAFAIINMGTEICHSNRSVRTGFSHFLQPMQPTSQADVTALPLSWELHPTNTVCSYGTSSIRWFGHLATHLPQALHFSLSTTATPLIIWMASKGHAFTQLPNPMHP